MAIQMAVERALATKMEELTWELEKLTEIGELVRVKRRVGSRTVSNIDSS